MACEPGGRGSRPSCEAQTRLQEDQHVCKPFRELANRFSSTPRSLQVVRWSS